MIRSLYYNNNGRVRTDLAPEEFAATLQDAQGLLWVDFSCESSETCEPILRDVFGFHPLAVDDALEESHVPKVDDWGQYLYLTLHAVVFDYKEHMQLDTLELDVFLGRNYLVTYQAKPIAAVGRVWTMCQRDVRYLQRGAGYLLYQLADELAADYMPVIEQVDEAIDEIEDQIFDDPSPNLLERLFVLKRALLRLRRIVAPQREVLNKLARGDYPVVDKEHGIFFRDVYDHLVRLHDIVESLRDLVGSALDTYLSVVNNRMNDVMKALTIITTLFMPLSFLSGFFGMNFFQPEVPLEVWTGKLAFGLTLSAMVLMPVGMYMWMQRRAWM
ncbi:MAG: magnesium/cobalt transporter CorA [Chloroflexota bacterium]|nr:magnesium/cobalt transporter CorA [Chloroflexota bacterium]